MSRLTCLRVAEWIQARNAGLSSASALRLEEHLAHCSACSAHARTLDRLQRLSDVSAQPLAPAARNRAVLRALAAAEQPLPLEAARASWWFSSAAGALAALALVALGVALRPSLDPSTATRRDRVLSGNVELAGAALAAGEVVPDRAALSSDSGAVVALAHARVELRAHTRAHWDGSARVLQLDQGSVLSEVDPLRRASFSVETRHFRALVLGTRFEVSPDRVRVTRGRVQVVGLDGRPRAVLGAGESHVWRDETPPSARAAAAPPAPPKPATEPPPPAIAAAPAPAPVRQPAHPQPSAADAQLEQARIALGRRELDRARTLVAQALAAAVQPRQRAEALTLRAECALVAGDLPAAANGYYEVAQRFASLPAGENALFAAARIDADRLRGPAAERGLTRYLARHPRGRFVKEAQARLRELRGPAGSQR